MNKMYMDKKFKIIERAVIISALLVFLTLGFFSAFATEKNIEYRPSSLTLSITSKPESSVGISWYSLKDKENSYVQVMEEKTYKAEGFKGSKILKVTESKPKALMLKVNKKYKNFTRNHIVLKDLKENTLYSYRVGKAKNNSWSKVYTFKTGLGNKGKSFEFINLTDTQPVLKSDYESCINAFKGAIRTSKEPGFILHGGDFVENGYDEKNWQRLIDSSSDIFANNVFVPVSGNHDMRGALSSITSHFSLGKLPKQSVKEGAYYDFKYSNAHFIVLNTNDLSRKKNLNKTQIKWLEKKLSEKAKWKIVAMHIPVYSTGNHLDDKTVINLRKQLPKIFDKYNVDLVIQGHDHVYSRTHPVRNGEKSRSDIVSSFVEGERVDFYNKPKGTVYTLPNTSGAKLYPILTESHKVDLSSFNLLFAKSDQPAPGGGSERGTMQMFSRIGIEDNILWVKTYTVQGEKVELYDSYGISKD